MDEADISFLEGEGFLSSKDFLENQNRCLRWIKQGEFEVLASSLSELECDDTLQIASEKTEVLIGIV